MSSLLELMSSHRMSDPPGAGASLMDWPDGSFFRPLNHGEFIRNPDGSRSTEFSRTMPANLEGQWVNLPSIWMTSDGPRRFDSEDDLFRLMKMYEAMSGLSFPRFGSLGEAEQAAIVRSNSGGVFSGDLAR